MNLHSYVQLAGALVALAGLLLIAGLSLTLLIAGVLAVAASCFIESRQGGE